MFLKLFLERLTQILKNFSLIKESIKAFFLKSKSRLKK